MGPKLPTAVLIAVLSLLPINGCYSQEELEPDLAMAMVDEEGNMWWDPTAKTAIQTHNGDIAILKLGNVGKEKRAALSDRRLLWPDAIVPFAIALHYNIRQRSAIIKALQHWEEHTCLRFVPRTNETDYINFYRGPDCSSYVGRLRFFGRQGISLGSGCVSFDIIVHEIGHAIGFEHEHSRPDRDDYVHIETSNIERGAKSDFDKQDESDIDSLGVGYDYNSIMHYNPDCFARPGRIVIEGLDPDIPIGGAVELSPLDILQTQRLYRCDQIGNRSSQLVLPTTPPLALPDGIQCGDILTGTNGSFASPGYPSFSHNQSCVWIISAPEGYRLTITITRLSIDQNENCTKDFIQVYRGREYHLNRRKICSRRRLRDRSISVLSNEAVVYYQTDGGNTRDGLRGFKARYKANDVNECEESDCHTCVNTPGSFQCSCNDGFYLSPAAQRCFDVNECALENGGCEHTCTNRAGSYRCECDQGFTLQEDGQSCSDQ